MSENSGSPSRKYVVFEESTFGDTGETYYSRVTEVEARNAMNALRKAFRELRENGYTEPEATLIVVPESMWRPTPVRAAVREQISVTIG